MIHEILLTFFFTGKAKKAPGTFGSLAALLLWILVNGIFFNHQIALIWQNIFWTIFLTSAFFYGIFATPLYTKKFAEIDHQSIVLDEVVGQIFALQATFFLLHENYFSQSKIMITHLLFCFIAFRFFDIKKPLFIGYCDRNFKSGFGVMFDDLLSGIVTALIGLVFFKLTLLKG